MGKSKRIGPLTLQQTNKLLAAKQLRKILRNKKRRNNKKKQQQIARITNYRANLSRPSLDRMTCCYVNTLNNPFNYPPIRLGWGTMVPTNLCTAYARGSFTTNADGSFAISTTPDIQAGVSYTTAGAGTATWGQLSQYANRASLQALIQEGRVVSGGIKVMPQVPATAVPGVLYAGSIPSINPGQLFASSPNTLSAAPQLKVGYGATGACSVTRPLDPTSYEFTVSVVLGYSSSTVLATSCPIIVGIGFPASTTVYYEAVLNIEGISTNNSTSALQSPEINANDDAALAASHTSIESMWQSIKSYVPDSSSVNTASSAIQGVARAAVSAGYAANYLRSSYQQTRANYFRSPDNNRVTIEEMD